MSGVDPIGAASLSLQLGSVVFRGLGSVLSSIEELYPPEAAEDAGFIYYEFVKFIKRSGIENGVPVPPCSFHQAEIERRLKEIKRLCTNLKAVREYYLDRDLAPPEGDVVVADAAQEYSRLCLSPRACLPSVNVTSSLNLDPYRQGLSKAFEKIRWKFTGDGSKLKELLDRLQELVESLLNLDRSVGIRALRESYRMEKLAALDEDGLRTLSHEVNSTFRAIAGLRLLKMMNLRSRDDPLPLNLRGQPIPETSMKFARSMIQSEDELARHWIATLSTDEQILEERVLVERMVLSVSADDDGRYGREVSLPSNKIQESWQRLGLLCYCQGGAFDEGFDKPDDFIVPDTIGRVSWVSAANETEFWLLYKVPRHLQSSSKALRFHKLGDLISGDGTGKSSMRPSLNQRLELAVKLVRFVFRYHQMGWVHKGLCGNNIGFFCQEKDGIDLDSPYVVGFDLSRPAQGLRATSEKRFYITSIENGAYWQYYTHPEYYRSNKDFTEKYDWYSVGVILLEIAMWKTVPQMTAEPPETFAHSFIKLQQNIEISSKFSWLQNTLVKPRILSRLRFQVGASYANAVELCLSGKLLDSEAGNRNQAAAANTGWDPGFGIQVLEEIERARFVMP